MDRLETVTLENQFVRLEPLGDHHRDLLRGPANDPDLWRYATINQHGGNFDAWMDDRLINGPKSGDLTFAIFDKSAKAWAGSSSFLAVNLTHKRLEIGWTWIAKQFWAGGVNPATKHLLMTYGFETLMLNRIELKIDSLNERSQGAVAKLGAVREGVFRNHLIMPDGRLRHSVYFSVIAQEWPTVRAGLKTRLAALR